MKISKLTALLVLSILIATTYADQSCAYKQGEDQQSCYRVSVGFSKVYIDGLYKALKKIPIVDKDELDRNNDIWAAKVNAMCKTNRCMDDQHIYRVNFLASELKRIRAEQEAQASR